MIWLHNSRIVAIFAVILLHTAADVVIKSEFGSGYWWIGNFYDSFARWCVPVFVMISGALLLDSNKKENLKKFYSKRLSRILIPILFWSFFFLFWTMLKGMIKNNPPQLTDLFKKLISGTPYYHMWFLYMITLLYLFTPFFRKIIIGSSRKELFVLVIFTFLIAATNAVRGNFFGTNSTLFINWFLSYIPFYFLGYLIGTDKRNFSKITLWNIFLISSFLTAFGCYFVTYDKDLDTGLYFYDALSITVIPMSVSVMYLLKSWTKPINNEKFTRKLSLLTFGIYLIHPIILDMIKYIGATPLNYHPALSIPFVAIFVFCSSLIGVWIIYQIPYLKRII